MIVGNDIVFLNAFNGLHRGKDHRFISKILCDEEKIILDRFGNNDHILWLMWSAKEAAYKCCKRYNDDCLFSPANFEIIRLINITNKKFSAAIFANKTGRGIYPFFNFYTEVRYHQTKIFSCSVITATFVYTLASAANNFDDIFWGIQKIGKPDYESQSKAVRNFLSDNMLFKNSRLTFFKDEYNRPSILMDNIHIPLPVSFSHDHHYVSYAFAV